MTVKQPQIAIVNAYTLIACVYCALFTIIFYYYAGNNYLGTVHLISEIAILINYLILQKTKNYTISTNVILAIGTVVVVSLFATGGWENTGYLWPFGYLPFAFFLGSYREAKNWVLILYFFCITAVIFDMLKIIDVPYSGIALFNYFACLLVYTSCTFLFQDARIKAENALKVARNELEQRVKERTAELTNANDQLMQVNEELERFAYVASHDLQEPLRSIASYTQLLKHRYKDKLDQEGNEFIDYAVEGAKRMQNLITDLLTFSRVGGNKKFETEYHDLNKILEKVLLNLELLIKENQVNITSNDFPSLKVEPLRMLQLFQNLISNAIRYHGKEINIFAEKEGNKYIFSVKDNGIGIEEKYYEKIFVLFQRLNREYPGTGMGLAICKKIVESHGGKIWVNSEFGKGTAFFFTLPE
jgi:signal transduction histidine kinase